jgi:hypothetical protein
MRLFPRQELDFAKAIFNGKLFNTRRKIVNNVSEIVFGNIVPQRARKLKRKIKSLDGAKENKSINGAMESQIESDKTEKTEVF